jgi:hypothetical protein
VKGRCCSEQAKVACYAGVHLIRQAYAELQVDSGARGFSIYCPVCFRYRHCPYLLCWLIASR